MSSIQVDPRNGDEILADLGFTPAQRAKVVRTGERTPIGGMVRHLVYRRDEWKCQVCGAVPFTNVAARRSGALHLDHIIPWSAGGSDRSDNLRTLCGPCNMERSNYVSENDKPSMPIVRICAPCRLPALREKPADTFAVYCACRHHYSWAVPGWHIV